MSDDFDKLEAADDFERLEGEPGHAGPNPYSGGPHAKQPTGPIKAKGTSWDMAKSWANSAALEAGPQIEGAMAALLQPAVNAETLAEDIRKGRAATPTPSPLDAYREVRELGAVDHRQAADTHMGDIGEGLGAVSTPVPVKGLGPGASITAKARHGAKVGGVLGAAHGAATSQGDLTKLDRENWSRVIRDALAGGTGGYVGGGLVGGGLGAIEKPARSVARRLPMDMLGVSEPARRSMQKQGIYDEAGDALLELVRPGRSGMRKGSLTEDAVAALEQRGQALDDSIAAVDAARPEGVVSTGAMSDAVRTRAKPFESGSLQSKQVASRMKREADNLLDALGSTDPEIGARIPLAEAEAFKSKEFGPGVAKLLRHAGEPAAKTTALGETYRALKGANEVAAAEVSPGLARNFTEAKRAYSRLAAPLEGASVERSGMRGSDFDLGAVLADSPAPQSVLSKLGELPGAGLVKVPLDLAGRAYGRGIAASIAEALANRAAKNTGGVLGGAVGSSAASRLASKPEDPLAPYLAVLDDEGR